jgi:hypothetical protein
MHAESGARWAAGTTLATRCAASARATAAATATDCRLGHGLGGEETLTLQALAGQLAGAAHGFCLLTNALLRGLLKMPAQLHFAENPLALHLLFERLEGLIDVIIANLNEHGALTSVTELIRKGMRSQPEGCENSKWFQKLRRRAG